MRTMTKEGLRVYSLMPRPWARPWTRQVLPVPSPPTRRRTSPSFASPPSFRPRAWVSSGLWLVISRGKVLPAGLSHGEGPALRVRHLHPGGVPPVDPPEIGLHLFVKLQSLFQHPQAPRCPTQIAGDPYQVPRPRGRAAQIGLPLKAAQKADIYGYQGGSVQVAPDDGHLVGICRLQEAMIDTQDPVHIAGGGEGQGDQGIAGHPAHGGDIGDVDRQGLPAQVLGG